VLPSGGSHIEAPWQRWAIARHFSWHGNPLVPGSGSSQGLSANIEVMAKQRSGFATLTATNFLGIFGCCRDRSPGIPVVGLFPIAVFR